MPVVSVAGFNTGAADALGLWYGSTTTDANGEWSVDYTIAGFLAAPCVVAVPVLNTATDTDNEWGSAVKTASTTAATGICLRGVVLVALGATVRQAASGHTVYVIAVGPI